MFWLLALAIVLVVVWQVTKLAGKDKRATVTKWTMRGGQPRLVDEVFEASTSGDLSRMLSVLDKPTHPVDHHYLLLSIVEQTYPRRGDPKMRNLCEEVAWRHLREFPELAEALIADDKASGGTGILPQVPTFQKLATLLTQQERFEEAVNVCERAIAFGLSDGTKSGYEGRIERIRKKQRRKREEAS